MRVVTDELLRGIAHSEGNAAEWMAVGDAIDARLIANELLNARKVDRQRPNKFADLLSEYYKKGYGK